jgi:DNA-binding NarL/FixJ family response regulator
MADRTPEMTVGISDAEPTSVQTLIRQLTDSATSDGDGVRGEVLLDVEVDGVRCVLVRSPDRPAQAPVPLSPRELEIAQLVARGYPNKAIASGLKISS